VRDGTGKIVVVGVLSSGSSACADSDSYERVSTAAGWLFDSGAAASNVTEMLADCNAFGEAGRCFGEGAAYCVEGDPFFDACASAQSCGFDLEQRGFRCVANGTDPCMGVGDRGVCEGATRLSCVEGELARSPCDACGASCVHSATDGRAVCNANE
jgi:hypothetical protein